MLPRGDDEGYRGDDRVSRSCSASAMGWVVKPLRLARSRASRLISTELAT
jgi:hypothetical protein